jgi:hypothetical protein
LVITGGFTALMYWITPKEKFRSERNNSYTWKRKGSWAIFNFDATQFSRSWLPGTNNNHYSCLSWLDFQENWSARNWDYRGNRAWTIIRDVFSGIFGCFISCWILRQFKVLSQIGLILLCSYRNGTRFESVENKANEAVVISHASIVIRLLLNRLGIFCVQSICSAGVKFFFSLFMELLEYHCFSSLARIVQERGIHKTKLEQ